MVAIAAVVLSVAIHTGMIVGFRDANISSRYGLSWRPNRFQEKPPMNVQRFEGDPFSESPEVGGENLPPPKVDVDDKAMVDRLESSSDAPSAAPLAASSESAALKPPEVAPQMAEEVWVPDQAAVDVTLPTVESSPVSAPRKVAPAVERVKMAEDLQPSSDLLSAGGSGSPAPAPAALPRPEAPSGPAVPPPPFGIAASDAPALPFGLFAPDGPAPGGPALSMPPPQPPSAEEAAAKSEEAEAPVTTEILANVDEMVVAEEKRAVEQLKDTLPTRNFASEVKTGLVWWDSSSEPGKRYFRVTIEPSADLTLPVMKKDVLFLVDASGSMLNSFRPTCDGISGMLRRLNEGDRFNIVFFRNRFSSVFTGWREATDTSFQLADLALKREKAHGTTDVFASLTSILKMPRDPSRPIIAVVASDGKPEGEGIGVTRSADIISRFSELNGGISSVYFYGISSVANAYLIDMIAARNRGDSVVQRGLFASISDGLGKFNSKFASPVVSDLSVTFAASSGAETYPQLVPNLCLGQRIDIYGVCPSTAGELIFSVKGLAGNVACEGMFKMGFETAQRGTAALREAWARKKMHEMVAKYTVRPDPVLMTEMRAFSARFGVEIPYLSALKEAGR